MSTTPNPPNFLDINSQTIYIHGLFDDSIVPLLPLIKETVTEQSTEKKGKIVFSINSNGGYVHILYTLLNIIKNAKQEGIIVQTIVEGSAYSCGSLLAIHGTIGERYISEYGEHLCHYGSGGFYSHTPTQLDRQTDNLHRHFKKVRDIYKTVCSKTADKKTVNDLIKNLDDDYFYINATDCIKYGLADKIL